MHGDGNERRSGKERRTKQRRSATHISIALILSGAANQRGGIDRRQNIRREADRLALRLQKACA